MLCILVALSSCAAPESVPAQLSQGPVETAVQGSSTTVASQPLRAPTGGRSARADRLKKNFPNIVMRTQDGRTVRFYDDLIKDRIVLVYFMFTTCQGICPATTTNMVRVQDMFGERFGKDVFFIGVTLTPDVDTPAVLKAYAERYKTKPGWTFVTGDRDETETLRRRMGVYDPDPIVDADLYSHAGLVTFGHEPSGRWSALPGTLEADEIYRTMVRRTRPMRRVAAPGP